MIENDSTKKKKGLGLSDNPMDKLGFSNESSVSTPQAPKPTAAPTNSSGLIGYPTAADAMDPANQAVVNKVNTKLQEKKNGR